MTIHQQRYQLTVRKTRLSHPNLHPTPEIPSSSPSSRLKVDIQRTDESSPRSATLSTRSSPGVQRGSRYSQPNLPSLCLYNDRRSNDRRYRMSQPSLYHSSLSGLDGTRFSFSSLQEEEKTAVPTETTPQTTPKTRRLSNRLDAAFRTGAIGKRERLSQPTLITGDYYPNTKAHQRLSQPTLGYASKEYPISLHSPLFGKKRPSQSQMSPKSPPITKRDRLTQLDVGAAKYQHLKNKFNRDRFSIPELETQNDLKLIAGTPKQRFSLDSQLNPKTGKSKSKLLPIASSPVAENQNKTLEAGKSKIPVEGLQNVLIASTTPIFPANEENPFGIRSFTKAASITTELTRKRGMSTIILGASAPFARERMSVPEIRNSSLRRLLDPPAAKQRHSITGGTPRQGSLADKNIISDILEKPLEISPKTSPTWCESSDSTIIEEPKHIQRHYAYTYETDKASESMVLGKVGKLPLPRKKFLESNFDEHERVITTVIETEVPFLMSSPKYSKKTHAYSTDPPKWMRKYMNNNDPNKENKKNNNEIEKKADDTTRPRSPKAKPNLLSVPTSPGKRKRSMVTSIVMKNTPYMRLQPTTTLQESPEPCDVIVNIPTWNTDELCQVVYETPRSEGTSEYDSDSSTSI